MPDPIDPRDISAPGYVLWTDEQAGLEYDSRDYDLVMGHPTISDPVARRYQVGVPGRDGALDLTEALGGVYFENRQITVPFYYARSTRGQHHHLSSELRNLLDGRLVRMTLSDDIGYFWRGRCQVETERKTRSLTAVTVTMDAEPHKYSVSGSYEPWKWSTFSFVDGTVTRQEDVVLDNQTKTVTLPRDPARLKPVLWLNAGASGSVSARLSTDSTWHLLRTGRNVVPEIRQSDRSEVTLQLRGTGRVGVDYRVGSL